jgi:hypothetical protein
VAALPVVEDLDVVEDRGGELDSGLQRRRSSNSTCMRDQNDSMTALSKQAPMEPIEGSSPESTAQRVNAQEVNWADSIGRGNTACAVEVRSSSRALAGVRHPRVLRGRVLSARATASRSSREWRVRSVPRGKYWRSSPLVFSLVPRCQGECGSQNQMSMSVASLSSACCASSEPWSRSMTDVAAVGVPRLGS